MPWSEWLDRSRASAPSNNFCQKPPDLAIAQGETPPGQGGVMEFGHERRANGVKSVAQAIRILNTLAQMAGPMPLKQIAIRADMAPSKVHRYLHSLCAGGLVHQTATSGAYDLGVGALRLGLAALNRVDIVNRAADALPNLVRETNADAFLSVWGEMGPTVVRFERSAQPSAAMLGSGVSIPLVSSATGKVFLAHVQRDRVGAAAKQQIGDGWAQSLETMAPELQRIREDGFAYFAGEVVPGRTCIAAPIISFDDQIVAAITVVSAAGMTVAQGSPVVSALLEFCKRHSVRRKGYSEETQIEKKFAV